MGVSAFFVFLWLISNAIVIFSAIKLNYNPLEHTKWGSFILVFLLPNLLFFFFGALSAIVCITEFVGGILAIIHKPRILSSPSQTQAEKKST